MLQHFETYNVSPNPQKRLQIKTVKMMRTSFYINKVFQKMCDASFTQAAFC